MDRHRCAVVANVGRQHTRVVIVGNERGRRVSRPLCGVASGSTGLRHGVDGCGCHVSRVRGPMQPTRASAARSRARPSRPLRDLHGEQRSLSRGVRRGGTQRPVLHVRQLIPHGRGARVHRRQQRGESAHHVGHQTGCRSRRARALSEGGPDARRRPSRTGGRCSHRRLPDNARVEADDTDPGRTTRRADALLIRHDGTTQGHHPSTPGSRPRRAVAGVHVRQRTVALPRGHDLPLARAAVPRGAGGGRRAHDPHGWHRRDHGALRSPSSTCDLSRPIT